MDTSRYSRPPKAWHIAGYFAAWLALGAGLWAVLTAAGAKATEPGLLLYLLLLGAAGAIFIALMVRRWLLCSRVEPPVLNVLNARPCLGEALEFDLQLRAAKPVVAGKVLAVLACVEEARSEPRHRDVLPVVIHRTELVLGENVPLKPGEPKDFAGEIVVPADGMQSFESHLCAIHWQLDVRLFVGPHLAWRRTEVLSVQPTLLEEGEGDEEEGIAPAAAAAATTPDAVSLELASAFVAVGEELKGRVANVPAGAPVFVELLWRTTPAATMRGAFKGEEKLVAAEEIETSGDRAGLFAFVIPAAGPMSYAGSTFSIEWLVRVASRPDSEKGFSVTARLRAPEIS